MTAFDFARNAFPLPRYSYWTTLVALLLLALTPQFGHSQTNNPRAVKNKTFRSTQPSANKLTRAQKLNQLRASQLEQQRNRIANQQRIAQERQAQIDRFAFNRFLAIQELWVVQLRFANGYSLERAYLGRTSYEAQLQAKRQFPQAGITGVRRYDFR